MNDYGIRSPDSVASGNDWSGNISSYQSTDSSYAPHSATSSSNRGNLITPPVSGSSSNPMNGNIPREMQRRPGEYPGGPSPPSSVARSSNGTTISEGQRKAYMMEESLSRHYNKFKYYLANQPPGERSSTKPNRARDKLLRLSPVQFQELSTDVFDELLRREEFRRRGNVVPEHLPRKDGFHDKRNQARQKLATLPDKRFTDLASDVFFELERRFPRLPGGDIGRMGSPALSSRGPPSRTGTPNGFRPGQGPGPRGPGPGMGPGPGHHPPRHGSLGGQVLAGLGIPGIGDGNDDQHGRPTAKTFQSNTIIPNKSTLVEDDGNTTGGEDNDSMHGSRRNTRATQGGAESSERENKLMGDYQSEINQLKGRVEGLKGQLKDKDKMIDSIERKNKDLNVSIDEVAVLTAANGPILQQTEVSNFKGIEADLESKLVQAQNLNESLQSEIAKIRSNHSDREQDLRSQLDMVMSKRDNNNNGDEYKKRYMSLEREYQDLQSDYHEQQRVTEDVRREATTFLQEMRALSAQSEANTQREESLMYTVHRLEGELQEWKARYARSKTQLRSMRASSIGLSLEHTDATTFAQDGSFTDPERGVVKDMHVTKFQIAIDEVLRAARTEESKAVYGYMKAVVGCVRNICNDLDHSSTPNQELAQERKKLGGNIRATANNFVTAAKNFAVSNGISPISLLDAAASHLTSAVVELIQLVKIKPTPPEEMEDDEGGHSFPGGSGESPGMFSVQQGRGSTLSSVYSPFTSPSQAYTRPVSNNHQSRDLGSHTRKPSGKVNGLSNGGGGSHLGGNLAPLKEKSRSQAGGYGMRSPMADELEELKVRF